MSDFDDDLNQLKSALAEQTPKPDATKRAANIALSKENFETLQESRDATRLTSDGPKKGLTSGVLSMLKSLNPRAALTASTALVAVGLVAILPQMPELTGADAPAPVVALEEAAPEPLGDAADLAPAPDSAITARPQAAQAPSELEAGRKDARSSLRGEVARSQPAPMEQDFTAGVAAMDEAPVQLQAEPNTEAFAEAQANPLKITSEEPVSTFSIDVDTASYAIVRSSLSAGQLPPPGAVRIEEMVNYFPYAYPAPEAGEAPFRPTVSVVPTPWNADTQLVHIAIQGEMPVTEARPPLNLVFLIDTSGSMNAANKLALLKQSFALMLSKLGPQDQVAIVTYAGSAGQVLAPTAATDRATILGALERLSAGGGTAGQSGLEQAYATAAAMSEEGEVSRVILATDGDFNVGLSDPEALKTFIAEQRDSGTYLSVMGFGRGNLDDATMQALAQNGNGQAAYIDTLAEAQKVLVDQFSGALFPIANDVKVQVEFNPAKIAEYRLIGYETRALDRADFNNDAVDAGEIGAGHSVTAIYEVTPVGSPARLSDPLRYEVDTPRATTGELGFLKLRYKAPGEAESRLIEQPIRQTGEVGPEAQFAFAIAGFGQLLRGDTYLGEWGYDEAIALASSAKGEDAYGYRAEAVRLMRLAQSLSE